ncbi:bifunctional acetate--CoA ligase family protein/GNAT family N-acetyltransferase [Sphingobium sp. BYY-5]|uniref:bifunctional acetate--CoA ligase family protein/GNAT family N-acetyltransferase n=1 Tax=Sphingobium sp. BYY-5 TaxID=2926400 RepID=UPI001FA7AED7|nr:bifunctional acetate--CoA ligase family protein/GNAT family N-acetyltransferase [Sphingobium sp. BYY-5]MCI4592462.1 bifunctional acetate--CoA ligase family protein/GNAT family N-acetyltransferase [Sphingobium sp. BYY-5]
MTIRNLSALLRPKSLALIGASGQAGTLGAIVLDNVLARGFTGPVYAVNPHRLDRSGVQWAPSVGALGQAPDLAIVMTPGETVPGIIADLGALGTRCAVVLSASITAGNGLRQAMLDAARPHLLRVVGPNCLGIIAPHVRLDATFARTPAKPGRLALISQSGALVTAILDWADMRGVGFSGIVSAGDMADVDLGDLVDLFAVDPATDAILLYVEGVTDAAKFLSAARAAARMKPVIAIKAGRSPEAAKAAFSHTGALAGSYDVYRAAFERAGIVLVDTLTELFDAAEILCTSRRTAGDRLGIVTNGGGAGILAVDALAGAGAKLATLAPATLATLDARLPRGWSHDNPVDVIGDAGPDRYRDAIRAVLHDDAVDALLVMNCPTGTTQAMDIARAITSEVTTAAHGDKPVLACWLGDANAASVRESMADAGIPIFATPDDAVRAFGYLLAARRARLALTDAPAATRELTPDIAEARRIIAHVRAEKRTAMTEIEAKALLGAYNIPTVRTRFAAVVEAVDEACAWLNPPFAVKIVSPDISHKSDVGGVVLGLPDHKAASAAACAMEMRITREHPEAHILGYAVEEMCERAHPHEMILGIATDPTFGPLVMVGAGGTAVEILADKVLALPPIDDAQARALIGRTRISKLLAGYRGEPAANIDALAAALDALSAITVDLPDIVELDINPLLIDANGVIALDARIRITAEPQTVSRLVLRPAPMEWASTLATQNGLSFFVRPVRADDEALLADFFAHVSPEDLRFRFLTGLSIVDHDRLAMMTRVDYRRTISFLAFDEDRKTVIATAMLAADPDRTRAEVALTTRADMKKKGLSWTLFEYVLRYAKAEGIGTVEAIECADHDAAIRMEREMGFTAMADPDDPTVRIVRRVLVPAAGAS